VYRAAAVLFLLELLESSIPGTFLDFSTAEIGALRALNQATSCEKMKPAVGFKGVFVLQA
jgi:hypothetical protein